MRMIGKRVTLREFRAEDISGIRAWVTDNAVIRSLSGTFLRPQTWEMTEQYLRNLLEGNAGGVNFVIAQRDSLKYLGQINLMMVDTTARKAELAIVLLPEHQGCGYAREALALLLKYAFDEMNLNRVYLKVYEDNVRAIALYERMGFTREGRLRQEMYREGRYWDIVLMGLLRPDYYGKRGFDACEADG